jgi:hypothetical protein
MDIVVTQISCKQKIPFHKGEIHEGVTDLNGRGLEEVAHGIAHLDLVAVVNNLGVVVEVTGPQGHVHGTTQAEHVTHQLTAPSIKETGTFNHIL